MKETDINHLIRASKADTNLISDGYHTFGELYEHRIVNYMTVCRLLFDMYSAEMMPVWMSKVHSDGSVWENWFLLGIYYVQGKQITYHLPDSYWNECTKFARVLDKAPRWDGHTSEDVLERLKQL